MDITDYPFSGVERPNPEGKIVPIFLGSKGENSVLVTNFLTEIMPLLKKMI